MFSAIKLRKNLLSIIQQQILPQLNNVEPLRLVGACLPLQKPSGVTVREMSHSPMEVSDGKRNYPNGITWDNVHMHATPYTSLYYVVETEADFLMGVTTSMLSDISRAKNTPPQKGGYVISVPAQSYLLFPPNVPQKKAEAPWHRQEPIPDNLRILQVRILPVGALCNISSMQDSVYTSSYSLLINDNQILPMTRILLDELRLGVADSQIARAQLLSVMLRLERAMQREIPLMTDGLYSRFPNDDHLAHEPLLPENPVVETIHRYVKMHLHESLTPSLLSEQVSLSPAQLNRILRKMTGLSTMEYVLHMRMEVARLLLCNSLQSVKEIAHLTGYSRLSYFSHVFHRHAGLSPQEFRRQHLLQTKQY